MIPTEIGLTDLIGVLLGLFLTLSVFSFILGDNFLFRVAIHLFIGVSASYVVVLISSNIIWSQLLSPLLFGDSLRKYILIIPLLLSIFLFTKISPRLAHIGTPVLAFLVGVGASVAIGGAVQGTIFPQVGSTINLFDLDFSSPTISGSWLRLVNGIIMLIGTISTLLYFQFTIKKVDQEHKTIPVWLQVIRWIGKVFIAITFGALFAGIYSTAVTAFVERWLFIFRLLIKL